MFLFIELYTQVEGAQRSIAVERSPVEVRPPGNLRLNSVVAAKQGFSVMGAVIIRNNEGKVEAAALGLKVAEEPRLLSWVE
ncbi:hypothetical protein Q3G72_003115 [Acer saccharum]|nr:hypothetical protein Q3G72_003115 [Acer saccharum]